MHRTAWHGACAAALLAGAPAWAGDATPRVQLAQAAAEFNIPAQSLTDALTEFGRQSGLRVKPSNGLGSRVALGGFVAAGVALPLRQSRREKTTSKMRTTPTTRANIGSDRIISPSTQVV